MLKITDFPRPDFERKIWADLNGEWEFAYEENRMVSQEEWIKNGIFPMKIQVPFVYQSVRSGIGDVTMHDAVWYRRRFDIPDDMKEKTVLLTFGAVDYEAHVWLNQIYLGKHEGGYTPFSFDVTAYIKETGNILVVKAVDKTDVAQPRGKQYWKQTCDRCWYVQSTGIWQSVLLEGINERAISSVRLTPDIDTNTIRADIKVEDYREGDEVRLTISYEDQIVKTIETSLDGIRTTVVISLLPNDFIDECHYWTPEHPNLYDIKVELLNSGRISDTVYTYTGMRKISIEHGKIMLNHSPYYMKMILDQGYWRESILTPPEDEALRHDIEIVKKLGFNGARKHQKIEDPRYYYWADKLGLLVWEELPSTYEFSSDSIKNLLRDFMELIDRDYNHPSIVAFVPLNESWGVRKIRNNRTQAHFGETLYHLAKSYGGDRLVSTNDGWENVETDIIGIHDYHGDGDYFQKTYTEEALECPEQLYGCGRSVLSNYYQCSRKENAFMVTEYGGIALDSSTDQENWGYGKAECGKQALIDRYRNVTEAIASNKKICGFCYTQLTDVYQEVNGLMDMDHELKFPAEEFYKINHNINGE